MITEAQIVLFLLVLTRVSAFIAFFPLFSRRQLPQLVKAGFAVSLTFFWYGMVESNSGIDINAPMNLGVVHSVLLLAKEATIGLVLSMALGLFFLPAKVAGAYVGQELGLSLASISDPATQDSSTLVTRVFEAFSILLFFALNLHHFLILVIHSTFNEFLGKIDVMKLPTEQLVSALNDVTDYGILMIAPAVILLMLITAGLSFLNKAAPTLNLLTVGMSLRSGAGILCLLIFAPTILGAMQNYLYRVQEDIENLLVAFR